MGRGRGLSVRRGRGRGQCVGNVWQLMAAGFGSQRCGLERAAARNGDGRGRKGGRAEGAFERGHINVSAASLPPNRLPGANLAIAHGAPVYTGPPTPHAPRTPGPRRSRRGRTERNAAGRRAGSGGGTRRRRVPPPRPANMARGLFATRTVLPCHGTRQNNRKNPSSATAACACGLIGTHSHTCTAGSTNCQTSLEARALGGWHRQGRAAKCGRQGGRAGGAGSAARCAGGRGRAGAGRERRDETHGAWDAHVVHKCLASPAHPRC